MCSEQDDLDMLVQDAQLTVERSLKLPLDEVKRKAIIRKYVLFRCAGYDHREAKDRCLQSYSSVWLLLASVAIQVLFFLLKRWWENRK